jgi:hypothetical protein
VISWAFSGSIKLQELEELEPQNSLEVKHKEQDKER